MSREVHAICGTVRDRARVRRVWGFALAIVTSAAVLIAYAADHSAAGHAVVTGCCTEQAAYSWWLAILRLPGSLVAPAPMLPVWGSLLQVAAIFALAEAGLGRRLTLMVALSAHLAATMAARVFLWLGPTIFTGLPPRYAHVLDTGPSAATVALVACLAIVLRAPLLGTLVLSTMLSELWVRPDLAGREHIVALAVGVAWGVGIQVVRRRRMQREILLSLEVTLPGRALVSE